MSTQVGGNSRFRGAGSLWKSAWKGRRPLSDFDCIEGFGAGVAGQFYENVNGPLPLVPANGFILGAAVAVAELPTGNDPIVYNGGALTEGWELVMFDATVDPELPLLGFSFRVYDGAALAAAAVQTVDFRSVGTQDGFIPALTVFAVAGFAAPGGASPQGQVNLRVGVGTGSIADLTSPYSNPSPFLAVGRRSTSAFGAPNCILGVVGGEAPFAVGVGPSGISTLGEFQQRWQESCLAAGQIVEIPQVGGLAPVVVNQHGWRAPSQRGPAPSPLEDFVGAEPLMYGAAQPPAPSLTVNNYSPVIVPPENISFPFA